MHLTRARSWVRIHGNVGVLAACILLGLRHLMWKRCSALITMGWLAAVAGGVLWCEGFPTDFHSVLSLRDLPDSFYSSKGQYKVEPYVLAASELQKLGEEKALVQLRATPIADDMMGNKLAILCRMLFIKKGGSEFRGPGYGLPGYLAGDAADWNTQPIELVDGLPFVIINGYVLAGVPEPASSYLQYCVENCNWNTVPIEPKSARQKHEALEKLLAYPQFRKPKYGREYVRKFLSAQIR